MVDLEIRDATGAELVAGCALVAEALAFDDRDALPPWLMMAAADLGGCMLAAVSERRVVGFAAAIPAASEELFLCGIAVDPGFRGRGVARQLLLAQKAHALARGCRSLRWTADPLSAPALRLYLPGIGARLVSYGVELYADVRPAPVPADDVIVEWPLDVAGRPARQPAGCVEIPFDHRLLGRAELLRWRLCVRSAMRRSLDRGAVGTSAVVDRGARRAWVLFTEPQTS